MNPAFANALIGAQLTANCDGFGVTFQADFLNPTTAYSATYDITVSGCVDPAVTEHGVVNLTHDAIDPRKAAGSGTGVWSFTPNGTCSVQGTAFLTQNTASSRNFTSDPRPLVFACTPPVNPGICHNIGGPRELGADCDTAGQCVLTLEDGSTLSITDDKFLGIVIHAGPKATKAHIKHGDGPLVQTFDPPLHLASQIGPHQASNASCMGQRVNPQPPEPGN